MAAARGGAAGPLACSSWQRPRPCGITGRCSNSAAESVANPTSLLKAVAVESAGANVRPRLIRSPPPLPLVDPSAGCGRWRLLRRAERAVDAGAGWRGLLWRGGANCCGQLGCALTNGLGRWVDLTLLGLSFVVALQVRVTPMRTEVIIRATRTQAVLGERQNDLFARWWLSACLGSDQGHGQAAEVAAGAESGLGLQAS